MIYDPVGDYMHLICQNEIEVKDTTDTKKYVIYVDIHLEIDNAERLTSLFQ